MTDSRLNVDVTIQLGDLIDVGMATSDPPDAPAILRLIMRWTDPPLSIPEIRALAWPDALAWRDRILQQIREQQKYAGVPVPAEQLN